jgi:hypothetical protein
VIPFAELDSKDYCRSIAGWWHLSKSAATVAAIVSHGATVLVVPRADPASSAAIKDATIACTTRPACATTQLFEAIFEANGVPGAARWKAYWSTGFTRSRGDLRQMYVRLWHGMEDRAFAVRLAEAIANRFPNYKARFIQDEGHYSLPIRHIREILEDLISI